MLGVYERYGRSVIAAMEVAREEISLVRLHRARAGRRRTSFRVKSVVEKPPPEEAPSTMAAIGRYVFTPEIFDALRETQPGRGGEIQLTDAINLLAQQQAVFAYSFDHGRFDVGNKLDYLKATVELAIEREDVGEDFRRFLAEIVLREKLL